MSTQTTIQFIEPLEQGMSRAKRILFSPFDPVKWLVIGFACWLAELLNSGFGFGYSGPGSTPGSDDLPAEDLSTILDPSAVESVFESVVATLGCGLVLLIVFAALLLIPVLIWLSCQGRFIFLDNVLRNRAAIREPWRTYRAQGNSLFLWTLAYIVAAVAVLLLSVVPAIVTGVSTGLDSGPAIAFFILSLLLPFGVLLGLMYTHLFLIHFIVPIMARERITTLAAWGRFLPVLGRHFGSFAFYGIFVFLLWLLVLLLVVGIGLVTCCVGFLLLAIPYVGTVVMLPIYVTYRAMSVAFLGQVMPGWGLPELPPPTAPTLPPGPGTPPAGPAQPAGPGGGYAGQASAPTPPAAGATGEAQGTWTPPPPPAPPYSSEPAPPAPPETAPAPPEAGRSGTPKPGASPAPGTADPSDDSPTK